MNTGRFVGSRSKSSGQRLEDTITKNNLEAVKEVVRQLRLRDIGGIIVIDFIDMANPKNRAAVEEALKTELERDRTKTYVVEISPLGLVEMTRQNVAHLTARDPDQAVLSDLRGRRDRRPGGVRGGRGGVEACALAGASRTGAFRVELNAHVASILIGPAAARLRAIEERTKRRFFIVGKEGPSRITSRSSSADQGRSPAGGSAGGGAGAGASGQARRGRPARPEGVAKDGETLIYVAGAAGMVGKRVKVRITRVLDGFAYAELVGAPGAAAEPPITAEALAEKPTRARCSRAVKPKEKAAAVEPVAEEAEVAQEPEAEEPVAEEAPDASRSARRRGGCAAAGSGRRSRRLRP